MLDTHHFNMMKCLKEFLVKFKINKENKGDKLVITFSGSKQDVEKMDKKIDAFHVLTEDCCCDEKSGNSCC
jgi:hypothetical protein